MIGMKQFKAYPAGTFIPSRPKPRVTHGEDGEVMIQITGVGPSGKTFVSADNK